MTKKTLLLLGAVGLLFALATAYGFAEDAGILLPRATSDIPTSAAKPESIQFKTVSSVFSFRDTERVVLRLPYKAAQPDASQHPAQVSLYYEKNEEQTFHQGGVICTDWQGNIYVYDPILPDKGLIKKFDRNGKLVHSFELPATYFILNAGVTRKGTLWLGLGAKYTSMPGLQVLAFKVGQKHPFIDWRVQVPEQLQKFTKVEDKSMTTDKNPQAYWTLDSLVVGNKKVSIKAKYSYALMGDSVSKLKMEFDGDELSNWQIDTIPKSQNNIGSLVAPDDSNWLITSENDEQNWENLWLWKKGQPQGTPLLRRQEIFTPKSWWQKTFAFHDEQGSPGLFLDGDNNIYELWTRDAKNREPVRNFYIGSGVEEMSPKLNEGEKALVVLNSQHEVIGYLPWTLCYFELFEDWIFPLPDGSGFYRQEYTPKELVVYFYPLPNSKAQERQ